jgi:hypothetical protein
MTSTTDGASIRYTVNSYDPTPLIGFVYDPNNLPQIYPASTVRAIAYETGYLSSTVSLAVYTAAPQCQEPVFNPDGGSYATFPVSVTMTSGTQGCHIFYTINDEDIEHNGIPENNGFMVALNAGDVLRAYAQLGGFVNSSTRTGTYTQLQTQVSEPVLSPDGYAGPDHNPDVLFHCDTPGVTMAFTVNSGDPSRTNGAHAQEGDNIRNLMGSNWYLGHKTVRVMAFKDGMQDSVVHLAQFDYEQGGG